MSIDKRENNGEEKQNEHPAAKMTRREVASFLFSKYGIIGGILLFGLWFVTPRKAFGAYSQINLVTSVKGILPIGNGGTGQSSLSAGLLRSSGSAVSSSELSGDAVTSASNAVTVTKVNGTSVPTNAAADQVIVTTGSATGAWKTLADCAAGGLALMYNATTHVFSTIAVLSGTFVDLETPSGTIDGVNDTFPLADSPNPAGSLHLYKNGQLMLAGGQDYTLTGNVIVYGAGAIPQIGDVHRASYRR